MGLLERLGGRQNAELRSQAEILSAAKGEAQTSRIKSAFEEKLPSRKVETFTGYRPTDTSESTYQQLKLKIHRQIVSEMSADEQELLAGSGRTRDEIQEIVNKYGKD